MTPTTPPVPLPPTITRPSVLYQRVSPSSYGSDAYLLSTGPDSAFVIVFPGGISHHAWSGQYSGGDSVLHFRYNAWSGGGTLGATGFLHGDTLLLKYNTIMQMTDFEDGVYVRAKSFP
ncbi:MAG: hypothetical protein V4617_17490 [Gemmatimonadota bacterium]